MITLEEKQWESIRKGCGEREQNILQNKWQDARQKKGVYNEEKNNKKSRGTWSGAASGAWDCKRRGSTGRGIGAVRRDFRHTGRRGHIDNRQRDTGRYNYNDTGWYNDARRHNHDNAGRHNNNDAGWYNDTRQHNHNNARRHSNAGWHNHTRRYKYNDTGRG